MQRILSAQLDAVESSTKKLSNALQFSIQLQKIIASFVGFSSINKDGFYESVNHVYASTCGYLPTEMEGQMHWTSTVHESSISHAQEGYEVMVEKGESYIDLLGVKKDGTTFNKKVVIITRFDIDKNPDGHYCLMLEKPGKISE